MKNLCLLISFLILSQSISAQIGLSGMYSTISSSGWDDVRNGESVLDYKANYAYGIDYWFKLRDFRVEFLPELSLSMYDNYKGENFIEAPNISSDLTVLAFSFNTQIYIFDLEGDCDCPTWGKEGGFFKKGFFLMAGPGLSQFRHQDIVSSVGPTMFTDSETSSLRLTLSAGLGFDIGVTKSITITPFGRFKWHSSGTWNALEELATLTNNQDVYQDFDSSITQLQAGIRLSYRWGQ